MKHKAHLISTNMGYGHQRAAYSLRDLAFENKIINSNNYPSIPEKDQGYWRSSRSFYEFMSQFKRIPGIGQLSFMIMDQFQKIQPFDENKDLSKPIFAQRRVEALIKKGWGSHLIKSLQPNTLPLITTFFIPAAMAEHNNYPGDIYVTICDADCSRSWAPLNSKNSRIKYFATTERSAKRLELYGINPQNIILTGFPLPPENLENVKQDFADRLERLKDKDQALTIMFAVGGAGAQKEIGAEIAQSLDKNTKLILSAGIRLEVNQYFIDNTKGIENIEIIFGKNFEEYFHKFNQALRKTDVLWTKPSELSLYSGLGLPIIMAPTIGSQEDFNREWLLEIGAGIDQQNPKDISKWLFEFKDSGKLTTAAESGFKKAKKFGTNNIEKIICG